MSDIYVRPYDSGVNRKPGKGIVLAVLFVIVLAATWWGLRNRSPEPDPAESGTETVTKTGVPSVPVPGTPASAPATNAGRLFNRARSLVQAGKLGEATPLLDQVIATATDPGLKNSALRMQGRANVELFLSTASSPLKKSYVIQPGDSLDRIARKNKTTVDLIRRMNNLEGDLIYPGARLRLPAAPFVVQVDKSDRTLDLVMNGMRMKQYMIGVGRNGKTPTGTFATVVHQTHPDWTPPGGGIISYGDPKNVLGTRWISILDKAQPELQGFGIHGTSDRSSIGGETSNGCIRMLNEDVEEVFLLIPRGTKVVIVE